MNAKDLIRAKSLSAQLSSFTGKKTAPQKVRAYMVEAPAPSADKLSAIIEPMVKHHVAAAEKPEVEITPEMVKKVIAIMHSLPEADKLEVSKGIRNANSFIFGGTSYKFHEMLHGAGATSDTDTQVYGEVVAGSGTAWTLANPPTTGTLRVFVNGQRLTETVDYSISTSNITTVLSWVSGTMLADYNHS